jgi:DNA transposition AAA+ family ATPase
MSDTAKITVDGKGYELILSTKAVQEISKRYGGFDKLGEKLSNSESASQFDEIIFLICLLANQKILLNNIKNPTSKEEILTEEYLALATVPEDINSFSDALMKCLKAGTKRQIISQETEVNAKNG